MHHFFYYIPAFLPVHMHKSIAICAQVITTIATTESIIVAVVVVDTKSPDLEI